VPCLIGLVLAAFVSVLARCVGLDRDRAFYPTVMVVIASYYALFAVMSGNTHTLIIESLIAVGFVGIALAGFKLNLWWVVGALATHGIFDFFHGHMISNPGVPTWWPSFCLAYDGMAAAFLALFLRRKPMVS
jgi:hypothetical protein